MNTEFDELDQLDDLDSFLDNEESHTPVKLPFIYNEMKVERIDPRLLKPNPWNPNVVDPINLMKLETSIQKDGIKRPIVVRELENGDLQIIGGQHRTLVAIELNHETVPVINRGKISDKQAKQETLIDNFRYGSDNALKFGELLKDPDIGSAEELLATMPIDEEELAGYFSHLNDDDLDLEIDSILSDEPVEAGPAADIGTGPVKTHQIIRFRVSIEDAAKISAMIKKVRAEFGYMESDDMTNDGDALVNILLSPH